jgi:6-phosphofructokinase 1
MVDPSSESFYIARKYMLRLNQGDFDDPHELAKLAATAGLSIDEFKKQFYYLIESDMMYKSIKNGKVMLTSDEKNTAYDRQEKSKAKVKNNNSQEKPPQISPA